jgi:hypothetical protein
MSREEEYMQLANDAFKRAAEEDSAQLATQWKILAARYLELATQSKRIDENNTMYKPIPWDRLRNN